MKKNYILLSGMILASSLGFAQDRGSQQIIESEVLMAPTSKVLKTDPDLMKKAKFNTKVFGDTLFYEDFNGGIPAGWSVFNNNANNNVWEWNTVYQNGQFSATQTAIASTTGGNGFMSLPADNYNTPIPTTGAVAMDTYFESENYTFTAPVPGVWITYQQSLRYCCSGNNRLVLQVSSDNFATSPGAAGTNTFEYDATNDIAVNAASGTVTNVINISSAAANQDSIRFRFISEGNSHYFWMIDDIAVIEGPANDLELTSPYMEFNETNYVYYPFYGQIPYDLFPPLPFFGNIKNNGHQTQTGVRLEADVNHLNYPNGQPGLGLQYSVSTLVTPSTIDPDSTFPVLTGNPRFVPTVLGDFQVDFLATSDSVDENLGNETATAFFSTSDTIFARDDNGFGGGTGPASYVDGATGTPGGTAVGDRFGTMYIVESRTGNGGSAKIPTSITFGVSDDIRNIGVEIVPKIWEYDEDSLATAGVDGAFGAEVASSFIPYTVTQADTSSFLTLPLDNGSAVFNGLDSGQYVVGWEVTSIAGGTTFEVFNDASSAALQVPVSAFLYFGHAPGWGWVSVNPVIRLNMANLPISPIATGLSNATDNNVEFAVSPNPNSGLFKITVSTKVATEYNLNVRNMLGQSVYTDVINVNGSTVEQMDLSSFEKGIYFVSLENDSEKLLKKVIVK